MRIFVDTNIISELLEERSQVNLVDQIFETAEKNGWSRVLSIGSFYTIIYLTERFLRKNGIGQPLLVEKQRMILQQLLDVFEVGGGKSIELHAAINDKNFKDLEDSCQFQCACSSECDVLLTINKKDFKDADQRQCLVMTPQEFIDEYL